MKKTFAGSVTWAAACRQNSITEEVSAGATPYIYIREGLHTNFCRVTDCAISWLFRMSLGKVFDIDFK